MNEIIQVVRTIGGLGDALTMTPGLRQLQRSNPDATIQVVIPTQFHTAIRMNGVETVIRRIPGCRTIRLSEPCPCSVQEAADIRMWGKFRTPRAFAFAAAMGVSITDPTPIIEGVADTVSEKSILIQACSAESYRDYQGIERLIQIIDDEWGGKHTIYVERGDGKFHGINGQSPLEATDIFFLMVKNAVFCVGHDSFMMHVAHAFGTPYFALMGAIPQESRCVGERVYPITADLPCIGCCRWAQSQCAANHSLDSLCMTTAELPAETVMEKIKSIWTH